MDNPTSVYRYYDRDSVLLYVSITKRGANRNSEHFSKEWWKYVSRQEVSHFPSRKWALREESSLIREFQPPFNVQMNPGHRESRSAYLQFANTREESGIGAVGYLARDWYQCDVEKVKPRTMVLTVDDPVASTATVGRKVNITGKGTRLSQCYGEGGKLYLVITRGNGLFPGEVDSARVKMALPSTGPEVKAIVWE